MKRFLLTTTSALAFCCASVAFAEDKGKGDKQKKETEAVIISTVEVAGHENGNGDKSKAKTPHKITIEIDGKKHELGIGQDQNVVKKIHEIIKDKNGEKEVEVEATIIGKGIIIGPDGENKEFQLGDASGSKEMLKGLPKEIRLRVEKAIKDFSFLPKVRPF